MSSRYFNQQSHHEYTPVKPYHNTANVFAHSTYTPASLNCLYVYSAIRLIDTCPFTMTVSLLSTTLEYRRMIYEHAALSAYGIGADHCGTDLWHCRLRPGIYLAFTASTRVYHGWHVHPAFVWHIGRARPPKKYMTCTWNIYFHTCEVPTKIIHKMRQTSF